MSTPGRGKGRKKSSSESPLAPPPPTIPTPLAPTSAAAATPAPEGDSALPPPPKKPIEKFLSAVSPPGLDSETCKTFIFRKEGHTLGNALRSIITHYPDVDFCGYSLPHPAEDVMHFRIQSLGTPALQVLTRGFEDLARVCDEVESQFSEAMSTVEIPPDDPVLIDPSVPSPSSTATFLAPKPATST